MLPHAARLKALLDEPRLQVMGGCGDGMGAHLVAEAGFATGFVSASSISAMRLAMPDLDVVGFAEIADTFEAFTGAKFMKGFNHLPAAGLAADPIAEGGHRVIFLSCDDEDATAPVAALAKQLGFAPVKLGKLNEGGAPVQARGRTWTQLIFRDLAKKEQGSMYDRMIWPQYDPKTSAIYARNDIDVKARASAGFERDRCGLL